MNALFWVMGRVDGRIVLDLEELADALGIAVQTAYNEINDGTFPVPLRKQGRKWMADARDVAEYLDRLRADARVAHDIAQARMNDSPYAATGRRRKKGDPPSPSPAFDYETPPPTKEVISFEESIRQLGERWERWERAKNAAPAKKPPIDDSGADAPGSAPRAISPPTTRERPRKTPDAD